MKKIPVILFTSLMAIALNSCGDDNTNIAEQPAGDIVEVAIANGYNSLAAALTRTNLIDDLKGDTELTVFAPTDEAFSELLAAIGQTSINDVPVSVLESVLLYHLIPGKVLSSQVSNGNVNTLEGSAISLNTDDGIKINGVSVISPFDVEATNGVIHTIDKVLVPESVGQFVNTILEPAYFNKNFSTLVAAAVKAGVIETLLTTPNLTIFAPTNVAFENAGIIPSEVDAATLATVLSYHIVGAKVMSTEIPREAKTLNGNMIYFSLVSSGNFINGDTEITSVDIESGTGIVHVINNVLLPPAGNIVETAIVISAGGEFTSLIAALTRTANEGSAEQNLITVLNGDGPFTVFAPTNAAFQALLDSNNDWSSLNDIPLETLITVLTYHVVPARAYDKDLESAVTASGELGTANGNKLTFDLNNLTINTTTNITDINYNATNGVIHVIDSVLVP